jgi:hypothetical protein
MSCGFPDSVDDVAIIQRRNGIADRVDALPSAATLQRVFSW